MKRIIAAMVCVVFAVPVQAEVNYNSSFYGELLGLGLEREAFLYALQWAALSNPEAEHAVAYAFLEGTGVDANPAAAIAFACGPRSIDALELHKLLIRANLRLVGTGLSKITCDDWR